MARAHQRKPRRTAAPSTKSQTMWTSSSACPETGAEPAPTSQYPRRATRAPAQAASGAPAPVRDPVGAADRVRPEAPHGAKLGLAAPSDTGAAQGSETSASAEAAAEDEARVWAKRSERDARKRTRRRRRAVGV